MKSSHFRNLLVLGLALAFAAVGCRKNPYGVTNIPNRPRTGVGDLGPGPAIQPGEISGEKPEITETTENVPPLPPPGTHKGWIEDPNTFQPYTVHFDYDSSSIKSADKPKVSSVADFLKANPQAAVRVEGNCDERGTEEYNRALGERRALALREELIRLGVAPERIDTISYGEDRPVDTEHTPSAWAKNRRGEFILLSPPK
ncbi:MAG TPA: OmpA family protein [Verrucomicrobiae bacterium]|nr:OmpA family protein [Verrucomicrobiae bacterium]